MLNTLEKNSSQIFKTSFPVMLSLEWNWLEMEQLLDGDNLLGQPILKEQKMKRQNQSELSLAQMEQKMLFTEAIVLSQQQEKAISSSEVMQLVDQCKQLQFWIIVPFVLSNHILLKMDNLVKSLT